MDNLPKELLAKIFQSLTQRDLLSASLVNSCFNDVITSFNLITTIYIHDSGSIENSPTRSYSKAVIRKDNASIYRKALESIGDSVKEVNFRQHETSISSIVTILNLLPNVKIISFYYIRLKNDEEAINENVQPLNGVTLLFHESNPVIFKAFNQISVIKIDLRFFGDTPYYNFTDFNPFMKHQKELKSFGMSGIYESNLMYGAIPRGDFKLTDFQIRGSDLEEYIYLESFLADHVETLEKLTVKNVSSWDCSNVIKSCGNLKVLRLEETLLNDLQDTLPSVVDFEVQLPMQRIDMFPNTKKLFVRNATAANNQVLSNVMTKVTDLSLTFGNCEGILMKNITKMNFMNVADITPQFFVHHNKITDLTLRNIFHIDDDLLQAITVNLSQLKILRIFGLNHLTRNALNIIKSNCKHLKVFESAAWSQQFKAEDWKCLFEINGLATYYEKFNF